MRVHAGLLSLTLCLAAPASAADYHAGPDDYRSYLPRLQAGDRLLLAPGDYPRGLPLHDLEGRADAPIVVQGPAHGARARFPARPGANTVSLANVRHVVIRDLELDGGNLPVDAVKAEGHARYAHYVTLERLYIHDHMASQQNVGISSKCPAFGWVIRGNRIERVGTGLYLGDSDGSDPFVAGLIEDNHISATRGYNLQIKHQLARPADLPEPERRHDTLIRRNFFAKADAQPDPEARPNVLVGHLPLAGPGSEDGYLIQANLFWQNPSEALFQGEGNLTLEANVLVNRHGPALHIQPHNDVPRRIELRHNTVLARDAGILVRHREASDAPAPIYPQRAEGNLIFAARPLSGIAGANFSAAYDQAGLYLARPYADLGELDVSPLRPRPGREAPGARDFFGAPQAGVAGAVAGRDAGPAYAHWRGMGDAP